VTTYVISISGLLQLTACVGWLRTQLIDAMERDTSRSIADEAADWLKAGGRRLKVERP